MIWMIRMNGFAIDEWDDLDDCPRARMNGMSPFGTDDLDGWVSGWKMRFWRGTGI